MTAFTSTLLEDIKGKSDKLKEILWLQKNI